MRAFEIAGLKFVEAGFDQRWHASAVQGDVDCLLGAQQPGADCEINVQISELCAEGARLRSPARG